MLPAATFSPLYRRSSAVLALMWLGVMAAACGEDATAPQPILDSAPLVEPAMQYDTTVSGEVLQLHIQVDDDHGLAAIRADWRDGGAYSVLEVDSTSFEGAFEHVYHEPGLYSVRFTATDTVGQEGIGLAIVWVEERDDPPQVGITVADTVTAYEEFSLRFDAGDDQGLDRVIVDFGDGSTPREFVVNQDLCPPTCYRVMTGSVRKTYFAIAEYRISAQVLDMGGQSATAWQTIVAVSAP